MFNKESIEIVAKHYCIAAIQADAPEGTNPRVSKDAMQTARERAAKFLALMGENLIQSVRDAYYTGYGTHQDCGNKQPYFAALGHDLYLTCAGHGVGFLDRDSLPEETSTSLDALCGWRTPMGEANVSFYRGWLYFE